MTPYIVNDVHEHPSLAENFYVSVRAPHVSQLAEAGGAKDIEKDHNFFHYHLV